MIFTNPAFLWALLLALIPIIIHFFNFQRPKKVFFSQVQFLKEATQTATSRNRLKHLLVLTARTLFIVALVLAFAQPILPKNEQTQENLYSNLVSLYIDNSFSLENEIDNKRNLDIALAYANQIAELFPAQTRFQLLDNSLQGSRFDFYEAEKLKEKVSVLDFSPTQTDLSTLAARQKQALLQEAAGKKARIFWISDFQKSQHQSLDKVESWINHLDTGSQYFVLPLTPTENKNVFIDSIWLETPFVQMGQNNVLWVRLRNTSAQALEKQNLTLFIDGKQSASAQIDILPEATADLSLSFLPEKNGALAGKISIEDYPITFDNDYHFVLEIAPLVKVVALTDEKNVAANPNSLSSYFEKVYQDVPLFSFQNMNQELIDYEVLQKADLLILAGISKIDVALNNLLLDFLNKGGSVAFFPAPQIELESYNRAFGLNLERLPTTTANAETLPSLWVGLETPNPKLPFFQGVFEKVSADMSLPQAAPAYKWRNAGTDLLKFRNGLPFLSQFNRQNGGTIFSFAAPLENSFSNLGKHALFVPVMFRMALTSKNKTNRLAYSFSDTYAELALDSLKKEDIFRLKSASDKSLQIIPAQRLVGQKLWLEVPKMGLPAGVYWVENNKDSTQQDTDNRKKAAIAFNYSKNESETSYYTVEELKAIFEPYPFIKVLENAAVESFAADYRKENEAFPLWRYFIYAALFLLLVETFLIRFWK